MLAKSFALLLTTAFLAAADSVCGQAVTTAPGGSPPTTWRSAGANSGTPRIPDRATGGTVSPATTPAVAQGGPAAAAQQPAPPADAGPRRPIARVTTGNGKLPNAHGQLWREYDISPYTLRVTSTNRPEQAIVDWILRETGYEAWHSEPLGILSATRRTLRAYHTPEMQNVVAEVVDRFVSTEAETQAFGLRVVTVEHPNWRARSQRLLHPVQVQTPGVQAWLLEKEDVAILLAELQRRNDYREHSSPHLLVNNGQSTVVSATRGRNYVRGVTMRADAWPGFEPQTDVVDEGFALEFSPLLSVDGRVVDATIKCDIDQVEKMVSFMLEVPTVVAPRQRTKIDVPQVSQFRFHERFRWPAEQVLLVGMGMVPFPVPNDGKPLVPGLPLSLGSSPSRADVLVFVESKGKTGQAPRVTNTGRPEAATYRGRY